MSIKITPRPSLIHVLSTGEFSLDEAKQHFVEIAGAAVENKTGKVLIDGRQISGDPTLVERFYYGEFAASVVRDRLKMTPHDRGPQFAYVLHAPVADPHRFGETVAVNRGMDIKVFEDLDEALAWLGLSAEDLGDLAAGSL